MYANVNVYGAYPEGYVQYTLLQPLIFIFQDTIYLILSAILIKSPSL